MKKCVQKSYLSRICIKDTYHKMSLRFRGGERLQRGRGIGGLLRLVKSVFAPLVKTAGKSIVKAATSTTGKKVLNTIKDQAIESGMRLATDALRGEDMSISLENERQHVKRKAADALETMYDEARAKKQLKTSSKRKYKAKAKHGVKKKTDLFD